MTIHFSKMHGLGNDFMVLNGMDQPFLLTAKEISDLADRHMGVGFDQLLLVLPAKDQANHFAYRIFNADGGEVEQCGNGARCFARFVLEKGLIATNSAEIRVETLAGVIVLYPQESGEVRVNMGTPDFRPETLPMSFETEAPTYSLTLDGHSVHFGAVSMGNPHMLLRVEDLDRVDVATMGALLEPHPLFPKRVNVGFMEVIDSQNIKLRVFERGTGETLACGTGACAAVAIGQRWGVLDHTVNVSLPGGVLAIEWQGYNSKKTNPVWMTGPAVTVFEGEINL